MTERSKVCPVNLLTGLLRARNVGDMTTTRIDHTGHNHPNTTAARTACRKAIAAGAVVVTPPPADGYVMDHIRKTAANAKIKSAMDRRYDALAEAVATPGTVLAARSSRKAERYLATGDSRTNIAGSHCAGCGKRSKAAGRSRCCQARVVDVCQPTTLCYHD